jgi:hypothetical protein
MPEILLVHGTGVRRVSYVRSLALVRWQAEKYLKGVKVHPCLWGEQEGASLTLGGASIPTYDQQPAAVISAAEADAIDRASWAMLREDPLFELRLLPNVASRPDDDDGSPLRDSPGEISCQLVSNVQPPDEFMTILQARNLDGYWDSAKRNFTKLSDLDSILKNANRDPKEVSRALARGLVASLVNEAAKDGQIEFSSATRDSLIDWLIPLLGERALAPFDWITNIMMGAAKRIGTDKARRSRRALTDASYPAAGDVLLYQKDGAGIREFIKKQIAAVPGDVIILAHSLGGIAAVDLLAMEDLSGKVKGLVTVGSQAPLLYEIGALRSLRCDHQARDPLPPHFPKPWINFWDPNDFLSYAGESVFGPQNVKDIRVESNLPFADSHGAYWDHVPVWKEIQNLVPWP